MSLAFALFPEHRPLPKPKGKKKEDQEEIPLDNDVFVPPTLTMKEIVLAIFIYIQEKKLHDELEPSIIVNDKILVNLFQCDWMNFADVQQLLFSKELVTDASKEPIVLT